LSLVDDHRSGGHSDLGAGLRDEAEFLLRARGEEWNCGEVPEVFVSQRHRNKVARPGGVDWRVRSTVLRWIQVPPQKPILQAPWVRGFPQRPAPQSPQTSRDLSQEAVLRFDSPQHLICVRLDD